MRSLQSRLLWGTAGATLVVFAVAGFILFIAVRVVLVGEFDSALDAKARAVASLTEWKRHRVHLEWDAGQMPEFSAAQRPEYFEIWSGGTSIARAGALRDHLALPADARFEPLHEFVRLPDGRGGRQVAFRFKPRADEDDVDHQPAANSGARPDAILVVSRETAELDRVLARLRWLLAAVCGAATISAMGVMAWVVRAGLRPVGGVAGRIARVGNSNLSDRIAPQGVPAELMPVVERLNELLARLEAAFAREKAFTADVAHELRTPLAGLETALEVCAARPREPAAYEKVVNSCLRTTRGMHAMVDTLLLLARADASQLAASQEAVDVEKLLRECWIAYAPVAAERRLTVEWDTSATQTTTDRDKLRLLFNNLLDNAVSYADVGGTIRIGIAELSSSVQATISNTGSRVSADEAAQVFERFWRGDAARTDTGRHCGLGLSLCQKIMEVLGGKIAVTSAKNSLFTVTLMLPRASREPERQALRDQPSRMSDEPLIHATH